MSRSSATNEPMGMLDSDRKRIPELLDAARAAAVRFLSALDEQPVAHHVPAIEPLGLHPQGLGTVGALQALRTRYLPWMSGSAGPRYFAFVTGGATPAALVGDWLTATCDHNAADAGESAARQLALDALGMVRDLLGLGDQFDGAFVTGATTSSTVALATARQWAGRERGIDASLQGVHALGPLCVLSGTAHSSIAKALSVIGLGRKALDPVATLPGREALDVDALRGKLEEIAAEKTGPAVVVANAGTVNTCDFDDLRAIASLKEHHRFWLHVDAAFGGIAAASSQYRPLLAGIDRSDSVTVDAHKWLNVPYDSAVVFTRHLHLQGETFRSAGAYLPTEVQRDTFVHLTPENSQRLRALSVWMTLAAYGRDGYAEVVERCCRLAAWLGERIDAHPSFRLLAPVRLNGVCFALLGADREPRPAGAVDAFLDRLKRGGVTFLTPTTYRRIAAVRVSVTNWRTQPNDLEQTWEAIQQAAGADVET